LRTPTFIERKGAPRNGISPEKGAGLLEVLSVLAVLGLALGLGIGAMRRIKDQEEAGALLMKARALVSRARSHAIVDRESVGIRFSTRPNGVYARMYRDGDGDGLRARDIRTGMDGPISSWIELKTGSVRIGLPSDVDRDPSGRPLKDERGVRFGQGRTLSFTPLAKATPGTLYIRESASTGWAVRVAGIDGRVRLYRWRHHRWRLVESGF
jgi:hypothetical protein